MMDGRARECRCVERATVGKAVALFVGLALASSLCFAQAGSAPSAASHAPSANAPRYAGATTGTARTPIDAAAVGNTAPAVRIILPIDGSSVAAPANILVLAAASDADGSVGKVEFFQDGHPIATSTARPYATCGAGRAPR